MSTMSRAFPNAVIGYSDHTIGVEVSIRAMAAGAKVVEKHFTLDRESSSFRDHALSADPDDFKQLSLAAREVYAQLGDGSKVPTPAEEQSRTLLRRSITARHDMQHGRTLKNEDLICQRPGTGLPPSMIGDLVGRKLRRDVTAGTILREEDTLGA